MVKYFIVKNESLINKLKEYESMRDRIDNAFKKFKKEYGIKTNKYYQYTEQLRIISTEDDVNKFRNELKVDCQTFKKNSYINKNWIKLCKENGLETPYKPVWELADLIDKNSYRFKFKSRLFSLGDEVYGTFEQDRNFNLSEEHFVELKASEFYKIIEDYESKKKEA